MPRSRRLPGVAALAATLCLFSSCGESPTASATATVAVVVVVRPPAVETDARYTVTAILRRGGGDVIRRTSSCEAAPSITAEAILPQAHYAGAFRIDPCGGSPAELVDVIAGIDRNGIAACPGAPGGSESVAPGLEVPLCEITIP